MNEPLVGAKKDTGGGAPMWMVTFADLATLLMCFFVLILSFSEMDLIKYKQIAGSMREAFGLQREVKTKEPPRGINIIAKEFSAGRPDPTILNRIEQRTTNTLHRYLDIPEYQRGVNADAAPDHGARGQEAREPTSLDYERLEQALLTEIENGLIEIDKEQQKLVIRIREQGSFPSGGAELVPEFLPILRKIAEILAYTPGDVTVAGHSDDIPIHTTRYRSNWELSAARAASVVHQLLQQHNMNPARFQIAGFADTRPVASNAAAEGRARNRRVELVIKRGADKQGSTFSARESAAPRVNTFGVLEANTRLVDDMIESVKRDNTGKRPPPERSSPE